MTKSGSQKTNFTSSPWFQALGLLVALVAVAVSVYFGVRSERRKELQVQYLSRASLVSPESVGEDAIQVLYRDEVIRNLTKQTVRLSNMGDLPIEERDIEEPVTFSFGTGVRVLDASIEGTAPDGIAVRIERQAETVRVHHGLLNEGDWIEISFLIDGSSAWPTSSCRISGVSQLSELHPATPAVLSSATPMPLPTPIEGLVLMVVGGWTALVTLAITVYLLQAAFWLVPIVVRPRVRRMLDLERNASGVSLRNNIARRIWQKLPPGLDGRVRRRVEAMEDDIFSEDLDVIAGAVARAVAPRGAAEWLVMTSELAWPGLALLVGSLLTCAVVAVPIHNFLTSA